MTSGDLDKTLISGRVYDRQDREAVEEGKEGRMEEEVYVYDEEAARRGSWRSSSSSSQDEATAIAITSNHVNKDADEEEESIEEKINKLKKPSYDDPLQESEGNANETFFKLNSKNLKIN